MLHNNSKVSKCINIVFLKLNNMSFHFRIMWQCPKIMSAKTLFFKIVVTKAPIGPVLNRPLDLYFFQLKRFAKSSKIFGCFSFLNTYMSLSRIFRLLNIRKSFYRSNFIFRTSFWNLASVISNSIKLIEKLKSHSAHFDIACKTSCWKVHGSPRIIWKIICFHT